MKNAVIKISVVLATIVLAYNVSALEINTPILKIKGNSGDFILQSIELYNDMNKETTVNISVSGISNYYLPKSTYVFKPYERKTITIGFTVYGSANGFITYEYDGEYITQIVSINSEKSIIIFPQNPKAGNSIAIITTSDEKANGFLFVSETGRQYPIMLSGIPITFLNISNDDYGSAMIFLIWEDKEVTYHYINITKGDVTPQKQLSIDFGGSKNINFGETRIITLKYGNDAVNGSFIIVRPDGSQILKDANALGQITTIFNQTGTWTFIARYKDLTISDYIIVKEISLSLNMPNKFYIGNYAQIDVSANEGNFTIITPSGDLINKYFSNGIIKFKPNEVGEHKIIVTCEGASINDTFFVYHKPKIILKKDFFDVGNSNINAGDVYDIYVVDEYTGDTIKDIQYVISVNSANGLHEYIPLVNGVGKFKPTSGYYVLSISKDDTKYIDAYSTYINVYGKSGSGIKNYIFIIVLVFIALILIIVYLYKKGVIFKKPPALER